MARRLGQVKSDEPAYPFFERRDLPTLRDLPVDAKAAIFDALVEQIEKLLAPRPSDKKTRHVQLAQTPTREPKP